MRSPLVYRLPQKAFLELEMEKKNILITGLRGVGKTTLVRKLVEELKPFQVVIIAFFQSSC